MALCVGKEGILLILGGKVYCPGALYCEHLTKYIIIGGKNEKEGTY